MNDYTWDDFMKQVYTARGWKFNPSTLYQKVVSRGKIDIFIQNPTTGNTREKITIRKNPKPCQDDIKNSSSELNKFLDGFEVS